MDEGFRALLTFAGVELMIILACITIIRAQAHEISHLKGKVREVREEAKKLKPKQKRRSLI